MDTPLARSYLFAPGDNCRLLGKVFTTGADAVVLDLEDAVADGAKTDARDRVAEVLSHVFPADDSSAWPEVWVRINALTGGDWARDVAAVVVSGLRGIRVPKAESLDALVELDAAISASERAAGIEPGTLAVVPTIEGARGLIAATAMATAPRVRAFAFGAADFCADVRAEDSADELETLYARSQLVVISRAARLAPPIAPAFTHLGDIERLRRTTIAARRLGFFGRSCIHPAQLAVVHEAFAPGAEDLAEAQAVIDAFSSHAAAHTGAFRMGDRFIDHAVYERAKRVVERAGTRFGGPAR